MNFRGVSYIIPILIVGVIGIGFYLWPGTAEKPVKAGTTSENTRVKLNHDYYVTLAVVELSERDQDGNSWESYNDTGPDIYVEIFWKSQRIFRSNTKSDTLIAKWSNAEIDLRNIALTGGKTSFDDMISAARLNIREGEEIEIRVYDEDLVGSALAGTVKLQSTSLLVGDTTYEYQSPGIKRLVLRVTDMSESPDVLK